MSSEWSGFTNEDLRRIRGQYSQDASIPDEAHPVKRTASLENSLHTEGRRTTLQKKAKYLKDGAFKTKFQTLNGKSEIPLAPEQCLSRSFSPLLGLAGSAEHAVLKVNPESQTFQVVSSSSSNLRDEELPKTNSRDDVNEVQVPIVDSGDQRSSNSHQLSPVCTCVSSQFDESELSLPKCKSNDKAALEKFEQKRKQMEAENAKRKRLLLEALDDRKKRTREEAKKIAKIQTELGKLDSLLSCDVGILRNQIETASLEFTAAQKRYEKAEKEFVEAKFLLFHTMERKEQLTDYLCTIIEQNEARKANKLSELMKQLELDSLLDHCENVGTLSHPCILNGMAMNHSSIALTSPIPPSPDSLDTDEPHTDTSLE